MGSRIFIFVFSLCTLISSAQWKSFYPEKNNKKEQNKVNDKKAYDFDTYFFTSLKYKALEDYKEAIKYLYKCQNIDPQNATVYYELCINYMKLDFYDLAIESIMQAISIDENNKWYLIKYSELLFANQDYLGAISVYKKLLFVSSL